MAICAADVFAPLPQASLQRTIAAMLLLTQLTADNIGGDMGAGLGEDAVDIAASIGTLLGVGTAAAVVSALLSPMSHRRSVSPTRTRSRTRAATPAPKPSVRCMGCRSWLWSPFTHSPRLGGSLHSHALWSPFTQLATAQLRTCTGG